MKQGYFKTGKRLQVAIDNAERIEGMQDYLDTMFIYRTLDLDYGSTPTWDEALSGALFEVPYWMTEGAIDYGLNWSGHYDPDKLVCEYVGGYHDPHNYGDVLVRDGKKYRYITSVSLPEEEEHQAEDGAFVYENRGYSFVRVLEEINE